MSGFGVVHHGQESRIKSPEESQLPSALNSPLNNVLQVTGVNGFIPVPMFGPLALTPFKSTEAPFVWDPQLPFPRHSPEWFYAAARLWRSRKMTVIDNPQAVTDTYAIPSPRILTDTQDAQTFFPATLREYLNGSGDYQRLSGWRFAQSDPDYFNSGNTAMDPGYWKLWGDRYFVLANEPDNIEWQFVSDLGGGKTEKETRSSEYTPAEAGAMIRAVLGFLEGQDLGVVWAGGDLRPAHAQVYRWPCSWRVNFGAGFGDGFDGSQPGFPGFPIDPNAVEADRISRGAYPYDGQIYPLTDFFRPGPAIANLPVSISSVPGVRTDRTKTGRMQIKAGRRTEYIIFEKVEAIDPGTFFDERFRVVTQGVLLPGQIIELPRPSITNFPATVCDGELTTVSCTVGFLPDISLEEYARRFSAIPGRVVDGF